MKDILNGKIILFGADGQLGSDILRVFEGNDIVPLTISDVDITDKKAVLSIIRKYSPSLVINTAAYTHVDNCEDNKELAFNVNANGPKNIAIACSELSATLLHISTDYVFSGNKKKPYIETDIPDPENVYGASKLAGEQNIMATIKKYYIVRTSGLFGIKGCLATGGSNFVDMMLKQAKEKEEVRVVTDQVVSPTYSFDLASKIYQLVQTNKYGTYHITNNGHCSWYDFTKKLFELAHVKARLVKTVSKEFKSKAQRPAYSVLDNNNLRKIGLDDMPVWQDALRSYLIEKKIVQ